MSHNITIEGGTSLRLKTAGKYCDRDIVVTSSGGTEDLEAVLNEQEALIAELKETLNGKASGGGGGGSSEEEWIGDGNTHIWISLAEGRTSPMLGFAVNGTATIDWGDGSQPDTMTGTSTSSNFVRYNTHKYKNAGDYIITLSGDCKIAIHGDSSGKSHTKLLVHVDGVSAGASYSYGNSIKKVELGSNVTVVGGYAFKNCDGLKSVVIPESVTSLSNNTFDGCVALENATFPENETSVYSSAFRDCYSITSVTVPEGVTNIATYAFYQCRNLVNVHMPSSLEIIQAYAFASCYSVAYYDFSKHTVVPTLSATNAFSNIPADCQIRVPASLVDEWKAASNWSSYASNIVGV